MVSLSIIREAIAHAPTEPPPPSPSMAAVAVALGGRPDALRVCFILRATRHTDRWSGQMAFPGGKAEAGDANAEAVAIREAHEEVGLQLQHAESLGPLPLVTMRKRAGPLGVLAPFAFYVGEHLTRLVPNEAEVERAFWVPLDHLWDPRHTGSIDWEHEGEQWRFPGIRFEGQVIWGLTLRVLLQWSTQLGKTLPGAEVQPVLREPNDQEPHG